MGTSGSKADPEKMPVLFVGHGSPMNALEENEFSRAWQQIGQSLPQAKAVLCISAHWETRGSRVTAMEWPRTIYDFYGFPAALHQMTYPASGAPALAQLVQQTVNRGEIEPDETWGLDHGAWSVLCRLLPQANLPVIQLSLDRTQGPAYHYQLGQELRGLRRKGVLIIGSGNIVHNLGAMTWQDQAYDWAIEFDEYIKNLLETGQHQGIIEYRQAGRSAQLAVPTNEHYLPLLYILAGQEEDDNLTFFADRVTFGSISMRSVKIG